MSYRLTKKEMRILLETRNESEEVFKRGSGGKKRKNNTVRGLLMFVSTFLILTLFMYALLWLGNLVGGYKG